MEEAIPSIRGLAIIIFLVIWMVPFVVVSQLACRAAKVDLDIWLVPLAALWIALGAVYVL